MADHGLFIGFGYPARGREQAATGVFGEMVEYLTAAQGRSAVESFDAQFLAPHGGDLGGFFLVKGERDQVNAVLADDAFRRLVTRAQLCVDGLGVIQTVGGAELQRQMGTFMEQIQSL